MRLERAQIGGARRVEGLLLTDLKVEELHARFGAGSGDDGAFWRLLASFRVLLKIYWSDSISIQNVAVWYFNFPAFAGMGHAAKAIKLL